MELHRPTLKREPVVASERFSLANSAEVVRARSRVARLSERQKTQVAQFIDNGLDQGVRLADLARLMGYSPDYFWRMFKKTFGQSPYQFILSRRVERAKSLLRQRGIPIAEVALSCGFANQGHLTKMFKQHTGLTPGTFRKQSSESTESTSLPSRSELPNEPKEDGAREQEGKNEGTDEE